MTITETVDMLEREFKKKYDRAKKNNWEGHYVNTVQWAYSAYRTYLRNVEAVKGSVYAPHYKEYTMLWKKDIVTRYDGNK